MLCFTRAEYGPLTAGFERWANLPPAQSDLQSFGHAAVAANGTLEIKLMGIDGRVMYSKTMDPPPEGEGPAPGPSATSAFPKSFLTSICVFLLAMSLF